MPTYRRNGYERRFLWGMKLFFGEIYQNISVEIQVKCKQCFEIILNIQLYQMVVKNLHLVFMFIFFSQNSSMAQSKCSLENVEFRTYIPI